MAYVYVLACVSGSRPMSYVGWTLHLTRRLHEHNNGKGARSTRGRVWTLLHAEVFATREEAMRREWYLKRDRKFRRQLLAGVDAIPRRSDTPVA